MNHFSYIIFIPPAPPPPTKFFSVGVGGLKTETGNFLLHFQNSKSSNRCRSVYGTDIINKYTLFRYDVIMQLTPKKQKTVVIDVTFNTHNANLFQ